MPPPARPLLKYACEISDNALVYRGIRIDLSTAPAGAGTALRAGDGRKSLSELAEFAGMDAAACASYFTYLSEKGLVLEGAEIVREDGLLSGLELFWRLECLLLKWRDESGFADVHELDREIAAGRASAEQVRGLCLELGHLLRAVPDELALAVAHAPTEALRLEFMEFYEEESRHGEMLLEPLVGWLGTEPQIRFAPPIPTTAGLLQNYRNWAMKDSLMYAVALMRDESSPLDSPTLPQEDVYAGMRNHYSVPAAVVDRFEWHAMLDCANDHGFFAERIFRHVPVVDNERVARLVGALRQIIELHQAFRWGVRHFYAQHDTASRCLLATSVMESWGIVVPQDFPLRAAERS